MIDERTAKRFWAKVAVRGPDDCWEWQASVTTTGYGQFMIVKPRKRPHKASRVAYEIAKGEIGSFDVCHSCDNPLCCNPEHLWLGTAKDNIQDCIKKGRKTNPPRSPGQANHFSKLTEAQVREIRDLMIAGPTNKEIAFQFDIDRTSSHCIRTGKTWADFEPEHGRLTKTLVSRRAA